MSGMPSWARTERSTNSTIEWTIDCGCTTTSIRSNGTSNSQWASRTSRPLFMSVAESIVIFAPIRHVGWRSACSTVTPSSVRARPAAERPARRRQHEPADLSRRRPGQALEQRAVLRIDREQAHAVLAGGAASSARRPSRAFPCWPARWCARRGSRRAWAPVPPRRPGPRRRRPRGRRSRRRSGPRRRSRSSGRGAGARAPGDRRRARSSRATAVGPVRPDLLGDQGDVGAAGRQPAHAELIREGRDQLERPATDRSGRPEHGDSLHVGSRASSACVR